MTPKLRQELVNLVERARHCDQNAMAMIDETRKNAEGGIQRAQESMKVILEIIHNSPVKSPMGAETRTALSFLQNPSLDPQSILHILCFIPHSGDLRALEAACVILSSGPPMSANRVTELDKQVVDPYKPAFHFGLEAAGDSDLFAQVSDPVNLGYVCAGHCIGMSRRIQQIRGGAPFSMLSADIGWELDNR